MSMSFSMSMPYYSPGASRVLEEMNLELPFNISPMRRRTISSSSTSSSDRAQSQQAPEIKAYPVPIYRRLSAYHPSSMASNPGDKPEPFRVACLLMFGCVVAFAALSAFVATNPKMKMSSSNVFRKQRCSETAAATTYEESTGSQNVVGP